MKRVSILNHVIGPIMRGPSSSHTAGPWRIGRIARDLLGSRPVEARFVIHPTSSLSVCYHDQGSDLALLSGLLGIFLTDERFPKMLDLAQDLGLQARFELAPFPEADHPNSIRILLQGENGGTVTLHARSVGGGSIEIASVDGHPLMIKGDRHVLLVELALENPSDPVLDLLRNWDHDMQQSVGASSCFFHASSCQEPSDEMLESIRNLPGVTRVRTARPVMAPLRGKELFMDSAGLLELADKNGWSLGQAALAYEEALLGLPRGELLKEMELRLDVMLKAVDRGLEHPAGMKLLRPMAASVLRAESAGSLLVGGPHLRAASRAMAACMSTDPGGVVLRGTNGVSAGVIPGVLSN